MRLGGGIQYSGFSNGVRYVLGWCCVFVTMLPDTIDDSSTSTRGLYLRSSQRCLIKRIRDFKEVSYLYSAGRAIHGQAGQSGGGEGIWQDAPEYKLIRCIPYDILSNVLETF